MSKSVHPYKSRLRVTSTLAIPADDAFGEALNIGEVINIKPPANNVADSKRTHLQSPNKAHEFAAGLSDAGEATINLNMTTDQLASAHAIEGLFRIWMAVIPDMPAINDGTKIVWAGFLRGNPVGMDTEGDKVTHDMTIRASGKAVVVKGKTGQKFRNIAADASYDGGFAIAGCAANSVVAAVVGWNATTKEWRIFNAGTRTDADDNTPCFETTLSEANKIKKAAGFTESLTGWQLGVWVNTPDS